MDRGEETLRMNRNKKNRRRNLDAKVYWGKRRDSTIDATSGRRAEGLMTLRSGICSAMVFELSSSRSRAEGTRMKQKNSKRLEKYRNLRSFGTIFPSKFPHDWIYSASF